MIRRLAKYVFIDVVKFSRKSAEAQSDIVNSFNYIVHQVLDNHNVKKDNDDDCILIPTGDGICISLLGQDLPYDTHIQIALSILKAIYDYNKATENETRQFQVRIGINQNTDILVTDINGRKNVAGAGVNMASRVMDQADGGQILVSQAVHHELHPSEVYMDKFNKFNAIGKHNIRFDVYQYALQGFEGLNIDVPDNFKKPDISIKDQAEYTKQIAYYIAYLIKYRNKLIEVKDSPAKQTKLKTIFWLTSIDMVTKSESTEIDDPTFFSYKFEDATIDEQFDHYSQINFRFILAYDETINKTLKPFSQYFDDYPRQVFVSEQGREKLKLEKQEIWNHFELNKYI